VHTHTEDVGTALGQLRDVPANLGAGGLGGVIVLAFELLTEIEWNK